MSIVNKECDGEEEWDLSAMVVGAWLDDHGDVEEERDFGEGHPIMIITNDFEVCGEEEIDLEEDRWLED